MLEYKLLRLLLNPHRIKYYYELDAILEYLDINHNYDSNEDLYNVFYNLKGTNDKLDALSDTEKKLVYESIIASPAYNNWVKIYEEAEKYRKLTTAFKFWLWVKTTWKNFFALPATVLKRISLSINGYFDYQTRVKNTFKQHENNFNDVRKEFVNQRLLISLLENKVFHKKKKAKKSAKKKNTKSDRRKPGVS